MRAIDLTHAIEEGMPVYPGTEQPVLAPGSTYEKDGFKETKLTFFSHTGTHVDPPAHLFADGLTLDRFPIEQFAGQALVVDCRDLADGALISRERIERYGKKAAEADFLLFNTGWDKKWGTDAYFGDYPCLADDALDFVIAGNYKGIGFDVIGLDPIADENLTRHKRLFAARDMLNLENLANLDRCGDGLFWFCCFPLKIKDSDGAPVRAVAWVED